MWRAEKDGLWRIWKLGMGMGIGSWVCGARFSVEVGCRGYRDDGKNAVMGSFA